MTEGISCARQQQSAMKRTTPNKPKKPSSGCSLNQLNCYIARQWRNRENTNEKAVMLIPRGQSGLEAKILALALKLWSRPRRFGLGLASISLSYYVIGHFSCKSSVKFGNLVNFSGNNLKSYMLLIIIWYFFHNYFWPRPHSPGLSLGLGLKALASASRFWPCLASLWKSKN